MLTNYVCRPDYISYELKSLPARSVAYWHDKRMKPNIVWTVTSQAEERQAAQFGENFFFEGYRPHYYSEEFADER